MANNDTENMTSLTELVEELQFLVEFQETPREYDDDEYEAFITRGIRKLYVDTGRSELYNSGLIKMIRGRTYFDAVFKADEIEYILLVAQIAFYRAVKASVDEMVSYTTDALSVTQGDKPYANISRTIDELENERRRIFYAMTRYTLEYNYNDTVEWAENGPSIRRIRL